MEANDQKRTPSSLLVFVILTAMGTVFYASRSELRSSRPEVPTGLKQRTVERDKVDAWLWQDPFKAVLDHRRGRSSEKEFDPSEASVYALSEQIDRLINNRENAGDSHAPIRQITRNVRKWMKSYVPTIHVMLIMVRDGGSREDYERRVRDRYAALTALRASGMAPEDTQHIRYFVTAWPQKCRLDGKVPRIAKTSDDTLRPPLFPYEWFKREELYPTPSHPTTDWAEDRPEGVLLVWLPEGFFSTQPLTRLAQLIDSFGLHRNSDSDSIPYAWAEELDNKRLMKIDLIGPSRSNTLRTMFREIDDITESKPPGNKSVNVKSRLKGLKIYSPWSTVSPTLIVDDLAEDDQNAHCPMKRMYNVIPQHFKEKIGVEFIRMIGSDDLLALELIKELRLRGVDLIGKKDHVALISEWDTFYGKAFPLTFATMMESIESQAHEPDWARYAKNLGRKMVGDHRHFFPENLHAYTYICGIDGMLPESRTSEGNPSEDDKQNGETESLSKRIYSKNLESPVGMSQLDYIARLAEKLIDECKRCSGKKLKAIGVVGSDVYDKLILFQALRERFSDIIFFTTDMDARLLHQDQFRWTRNVVVASNFGLELSDSYQRNVYQCWQESSFSSFRDNYQTALFFACRVALGLHVDPNSFEEEIRFRQEPGLIDQLFYELRLESTDRYKMLRDAPDMLLELISHPRLFEIGRGASVDLSTRINDARNKEEDPYMQIHPEPHNRFPGWWTFTQNFLLILIAALICVYLLVQLSLALHTAVICPLAAFGSALSRFIGVGKPCESPSQPKAEPGPGQSMATIYMVILSATVVIVFISVAIIDHYRPGGEQISFVAGTSIWPGSVLRLCAIILSAFLLGKAVHDLQTGERDLCKWFDPLKPGKLMLSAISYGKWREQENLSGWARFPLHPHTWWRYRQRRIGIVSWKTDHEFSKAERLWKGYLDRGTFWNRVHRLILPILLFAVLLFVLCWYFGRPNTPHRGRVSWTVDAILALFCVFSMVFLMFFVVDATRLCLQPIHAMIRHRNWPKELINKYKKNSAIEPRDVEHWLDVQFIAQLTESVGKLIYYPFIITGIMIAARWRYFDNWDWPVPLITVYMMCSVYMISCAVRLQLAAKEARRKAIDELQTTLDGIRFVEPKRSEQIDYLIGRINSLRQGAFQPFLENPVVHVLIPSGGISLFTLLRFLPAS